jgi:hypothetical protein
MAAWGYRLELLKSQLSKDGLDVRFQSTSHLPTSFEINHKVFYTCFISELDSWATIYVSDKLRGPRYYAAITVSDNGKVHCLELKKFLHDSN